MQDGSKWDVPVGAIAMHRANYYKSEYCNDLSESLKQDTLPLFEDVPYEIKDWAENNMNWSDVSHVAKMVRPPQVDFQEGWVNGEKELL